MALKAGDLDRLPKIGQSSRLKCVQCWSGRVKWEGFRAQELLKLAPPKAEGTWVRVECADKYLRLREPRGPAPPADAVRHGHERRGADARHGAPLRLVLPHRYGYKSSKLITSLTFVSEGGRGLQADGWPFYSESGDILPGVDHPFEFPDDVRKIAGGEITGMMAGRPG